MADDAPIAAPKAADLLTSEQKSAPEPAAGRGLTGDSTVYVVDCHSLIFQVFHAIPEMTSPGGEPVNAVYGFTRDLVYLLQEKRPSALVCAFDTPGPTFRKTLYDGYKADRGAMPEELRSQLPKIEAVVDAMGLPRLGEADYEADDLLATLARQCDEAGARCFLVTGDKDCRQLITKNVSIYNIRKDLVYTAGELMGDWGIEPEQVVDFQALVGDKVDCVPGVPLIGPKIAAELINEFGDLENLLANADKVKGAKRKQNLVEFADQARLSKKLVRLEPQVPLEGFDWALCRVDAQDGERMGELFSGYGFRGLAEKAAELTGGAAAEPEADWDVNYRLVNTSEALAELVVTLSEQERIALDTETTSLNARTAEIVGLSFAWAPGEAAYVAIRGPATDRVLDPAATLDALRPVLENPAIEKIGQNLKYDLTVLRAAGVRVEGVAFDTMIASYLLDAGERTHNLDHLAQRYLGHTNTKIEELIGKGKNQKRMDTVSVAAVSDYAAEDADVPLRLAPILQDRLDERGLSTLCDDVETPLVGVLSEMEYHGVRVDAERLGELSERFAERMQTLAEEIEELAGHPFNLASPKQLAEVLFQELRLPVVKKTKTGPSTDASVLEQLADLHPLPRLIVEHRQYAKLKGTYVDALPLLIAPETGRLHCSFNQVVAATGRLSSSDPNLQNIPIRTEEGRLIRSAFVAGPSKEKSEGWKLLAADYSQIELRVLAHYSEDETLCRAFAEQQDIHTLVASQVNGVPIDSVTSEQRRGAKAVNFGIIYGQSAFGLAKSLGIPKDEAARFIDEYFARYPGVGEFMNETLERCHREGRVETLLGRQRKVEGVRRPAVDKDALFDARPAPLQMTLPERTAVNTVIQGTAADLIKLAMLAIDRRMKAEGFAAKMILQIHDELVFDCPEEELERLTNLVREEMQSVLPLRVPLAVDIATGDNWAECK
ncbi:DNA polymerase I [Pseudobythopirellula maris]|uniref:DNA polymerase I n=1 Tax=Pseudobythopirellula maris TaxID=2527991 RepID=A0A5C5ZQS9_9BACT|nr:DNA polymerase I [Pseudobythopirellula maris]TWT89630.1 DNA polymerase I [Pseudobythopirellula maris]